MVWAGEVQLILHETLWFAEKKIRTLAVHVLIKLVPEASSKCSYLQR